MLTAKIKVMPKASVLDPQGKVVMQSLETMGFVNIEDVRLGKYIEIKLENMTKQEAEKTVDDMCQKLLANLVIESYVFDIV
ncbi:phosphoribosylformylglycinamidine synthase subunit PurS [bacterium]|nr:MAG: phosphoribosylformylglycinamidine synthase subunit PurS [bacterium]